MMCLVNTTTTVIKFTYLMNVNCVIGQATPILTHSSTNVMCFGVKNIAAAEAGAECAPTPSIYFSTQLEG